MIFQSNFFIELFFAKNNIIFSSLGSVHAKNEIDGVGKLANKLMFRCPFSQPLSLVSTRTLFKLLNDAFQTAKWCVFYKKFLYESCLKNQINLFF